VRGLAEIRKRPEDELLRMIGQNFRRLFQRHVISATGDGLFGIRNLPGGDVSDQS
jgi:hypothetical protein